MRVEPNHDGWRLDLFLTARIPRITRSQARRVIVNGALTVAGIHRKKPGTRVRTGDRVRIPRFERADPETPGIDSVRELARNGALVALWKPAGMLVHRNSQENTRTVGAYLAATYPGERVETVHRIDRDTSGVLVCARGLDAIRVSRAQIAAQTHEKIYTALVHDPDDGFPTGVTRSIDAPLGFDTDSEVRLRMGHGELPCRTTATCVARFGPTAKLSVNIEHGRQHQIRVHLAMLGTPIVGDKLYAMGDEFFIEWSNRPGAADLVQLLPTRWHCLHATRMVFETSHGVLDVSAPLPAHMCEFETQWEAPEGSVPL